MEFYFVQGERLGPMLTLLSIDTDIPIYEDVVCFSQYIIKTQESEATWTSVSLGPVYMAVLVLRPC